jgi:hypothetical protein
MAPPGERAHRVKNGVVSIDTRLGQAWMEIYLEFISPFDLANETKLNNFNNDLLYSAVISDLEFA